MTTGLPAVVLGPNPPDPPKDPAAPPKDPAVPPSDPAAPPSDPAAPPEDPAAPPKDPAAPPKDPAIPPKDPAAPPKDPAAPPSDPAVPPRDPEAPPLRDEPVRAQAERRTQAQATMQSREEVKKRGRSECHPHSPVVSSLESGDIRPPMNSWRTSIDVAQRWRSRSCRQPQSRPSRRVAHPPPARLRRERQLCASPRSPTKRPRPRRIEAAPGLT